MATGRWITLGKFFADSGTVYLAGDYVRHPSYLYEGRVADWGFIERSIAVPMGLPRQTRVQVRILDTDGRLRQNLLATPPKYRLFEIRDVQEGQPESNYEPNFIGQIQDWKATNSYVELVMVDLLSVWMEIQIPGLGNRTNFPNLAEGIDDFFIPIICGEVLSPDDNQQGQLELPHMGLSDLDSFTVVDRWALAQHPIFGLAAVFRKAPADSTFILVDESEYQITQDEPRTIDGLEYNLTFLDFFEEQDAGTKIRVDPYGFAFRGAFGDMPAVDTSSSGPLRNPIDFLINMIYALAHELRVPRYNVDSFATAREQFQTLLIAGSTADSYKCDGCLDRPTTVQEFFGQLLTSHGFALYTNGQAEIEVRVIDTPGISLDGDIPDFSETLDIVANTFEIHSADPTYNRFDVKYARSYADDKWTRKFTWDNESDQFLISTVNESDSTGMTRDPHIETESVEFWFVRDPLTATSNIIRRATFEAIGSFRVEFEVKSPESVPNLELGKRITVTHAIAFE
jgi:hypothetical protein